MRRFFCLLLVVLLNILFIFSPSMAEAATANCSLTTVPYPVTVTHKIVNLTIKSPDFVDGHEYKIKMNGQEIGIVSDAPFTSRQGLIAKPTNQTITINNINGAGIINPVSPSDREFMPGDYTISIFPWTPGLLGGSTGSLLCNVSFPVKNGPTSDSCYIKFITQKCTPDQGIAFYAIFSDKSNPSELHHIILRRDGRNGTTIPPDNLAPPKSQLDEDLGGPGVDLGKFEPGTYYVEVRNSYSILKNAGESLACNQFFTIYPSGTKQDGCGIGTTVDPSAVIWGDVQPPAGEKNICIPSSTGGKTSFTCDTAIGNIETEPTLFVKKMFGFLLGISGGIALLLIILSGYKFMTSQGNPEKLQGAKETLTSAIVGLMFIIFSVVILEVIGVDILNIPGFGK